jgi:hypothetical protein
MLSIDRQAEKIMRRDHLIRQLYLLIIALGLIILTLSIMILVLTQSAAAAPSTVCLSKKEARHLWPRAHLYWYSADHCWSDRRGPPRNIKVDPVPHPVRAEAKSLPALPAVKLQAPLRSDEPLKVTEDGCCWPPLEDLPHEALREYGLRILAERMNGK